MIYTFDQYLGDTTTFEVRRDGTGLVAQPQVMDLLVLLLVHQDRVVTRAEIFQQICKGRIISDTALSSRIKSLQRLVSRGLRGSESRSQLGEIIVVGTPCDQDTIKSVICSGELSLE
jgi:DNA-binding winged helix-turn-helix (wHTH) protein